jgi:acyl carrier protein
MISDPQPQIREFINERFPGAQIGDEGDIFALGFVNSLFAMELVLYIERTFEFTLENEDLTRDNFRTINAMAELVRRRTALAARMAP